MGYHSDVGVCLTFENNDNFKAFAAKALFEGVKPEIFELFHHVTEDVKEPRVVILMTLYGVKWYRDDPDFEEVVGVDKLWNLAADDVENELVESGRYVTIGEDNDVREDDIQDNKSWNCHAIDYLGVTSPQLEAPKLEQATARDLIKEQKDVDKI